MIDLLPIENVSDNLSYVWFPCPRCSKQTYGFCAVCAGCENCCGRRKSFKRKDQVRIFRWHKFCCKISGFYYHLKRHILKGVK